jgi:hypothetical protein
MLLEDRSELRDIIARNVELRTWLISRFEPKDGERVHWNEAEPMVGVAEVIDSRGSYPAFLQLSKKTDRSPLLKFIALVSEFYWYDNDKDLEQLSRSVLTSKTTRLEYVQDMIKLEFKAKLGTKRFLEKHGLLTQEIVDSGVLDELVRTPDRFSDYTDVLNSLPNRHGWREFYEAHYDKLRQQVK